MIQITLPGVAAESGQTDGSCHTLRPVKSCSKPGCRRPAAVLLVYDYGSRLASLEDAPDGETSPHFYAMCHPCADRLTPPRGWLLDDRRSRPPLFFEAATASG
ncbi:MAG: DUF3499 family protein [Actinomycetota bacterium]